MNERHLDWEGCCNVRDLGGLGSIRRGALVRGDSSGALTERGWAALEAHGVRTVVDLRNDDERAGDRAPAPRVTIVRYPLDGMHDRAFWGVWQPRPEFGTPLYYQPHLEHFPERSAAVLKAIAHAAPGGVYFHCGIGRDRTGLIAMLLLTLVGVDADAIAADYALSYERLAARHAARGEPDEGAELRAFMTARGTSGEAEVQRILREIDVTATLRSGGATDEDFAALRARSARTVSSEASLCPGSRA